MCDHIKFSLPDAYIQQRLTGALADHYVVKKERPALKRMAIYDTFDWRLFNKSFFCTLPKTNSFYANCSKTPLSTLQQLPRHLFLYGMSPRVN